METAISVLKTPNTFITHFHSVFIAGVTSSDLELGKV